MALALSIFLLVLLTELISWVGKSSMMEVAFELYLRIFYSKKVRERNQLKATHMTTKAELMQTSSQDQFAKWAKLKRKIDKGFADLETLNKDLASSRSAFSVKFNSFIWLSTTGAQFVVGWWYRKAAVFYLPPGWLGPLAWWMAFPFAPTGSVSCGMWQFACRRVIKVGERVAKDFMSADSTSAFLEEVPGEASTDKAKVQ